MPQWATFAGFAIVVTAGLLLLSHASRGVIDGTDADGAARSSNDSEPRHDAEETIVLPKSGVSVRVRDRNRAVNDSSQVGNDSSQVGNDDSHAVRDDARIDNDERGTDTGGSRTPTEPQRRTEPSATTRHTDQPPVPDLSTASLLANVAVSQGLFGVLLLAGAWYAEIQAWAFGVATDAVSLHAAALGVGLGVALYVANEAGATVGARFGLGEGERLRRALAPDSPLGWAALLFVVLPVIAAFEELLFRGALVGVLAAGYGVSPWLLALGSSVAFGVGHGAQGRVGVLVTATLGFVLAAAFILTESLVVVVIAHYLVNALEFVVHEGAVVEWVRSG
ncbi:CPBP family intramembrane glutamic endopeptidase [Halobellus captivus]|uniref:CPBP family intramembrane glutamic endopeptidase n=1 Tax=Halobellus captivus TaxID=2592614 RepID=UPI0011A1E15D|nr:CPBP family intramembrane glutamic endopeptidase [Halobellus captivus]